MEADRVRTGYSRTGTPARLRAVISGRVQGVFFRATTKREAEQLRLSGTVRNRSDGTVEVVAEGCLDRIEQLLLWLHRGPPQARVDRVDVVWEEGTGSMRGFRIVG